MNNIKVFLIWNLLQNDSEKKFLIIFYKEHLQTKIFIC